MIARLLLPLLAAMWPAEVQKAEFRTYQDGKLGFSFRYPADSTPRTADTHILPEIVNSVRGETDR